MSRALAGLATVPAEPIPLSVLTGFLGSGKTTILSRVLAVPDLRDTAVLISEFGSIALDHLLLEATTDDVIELPNGCTCCSVRQGLADSFYKLLRSRQAGAGKQATNSSFTSRCFVGASVLSMRRSAAITASFLLFARTVRVFLSNDVDTFHLPTSTAWAT